MQYTVRPWYSAAMTSLKKIRRVEASGEAVCIHCDEVGKVCCGGPYTERIKGGKKVRYVEDPACVDCHADSHPVTSRGRVPWAVR